MKDPGKDSCRPDRCALPLNSDTENSHLQFIPRRRGESDELNLQHRKETPALTPYILNLSP